MYMFAFKLSITSKIRIITKSFTSVFSIYYYFTNRKFCRNIWGYAYICKTNLEIFSIRSHPLNDIMIKIETLK